MHMGVGICTLNVLNRFRNSGELMGKTHGKFKCKNLLHCHPKKAWGGKKKNHKKEKEPKNYNKNVMKVLELPNFAMSLLEMFLQGHPCYQSEKKFVNVNSKSLSFIPHLSPQ